MNSKEEILEFWINHTKSKMLLASEVEYKKHNGIEYRMINEDIVKEAMDEYRSIGEQEAREKVIGELVEWMEGQKEYAHPFYQNGVNACITHAKSLLKQEVKNCECGAKNMGFVRQVEGVLYCCKCDGIVDYSVNNLKQEGE